MKTKYCIILASSLILGLLPLTPASSQPSSDDPYEWIMGKNPHPFIELTYGIDWPRHKYLEAEFPTVGMLEMRGGYQYIDSLKGGVLAQAEGVLLGGWYSSKLGGGSNGTAGFKGTLGRFGFGSGQGYGYDLKGSMLMLYFRTAGSWTQLTTDRPATLSESDNEILDRYEGTFRFGMSAESGVRADFGTGFSLSTGYEVNVIYPRFVFFEWLGSNAIAGGANGIISFFGKRLLEGSPEVAPIIIFVVKSAVAFGVYQLWREEMNWPFDSETPLTHETLRFTVAFNF